MESQISFKLGESFYEIDDGQDKAVITIICPDGVAKIETDNSFIVELFKEGARINRINTAALQLIDRLEEKLYKLKFNSMALKALLEIKQFKEGLK